MPYQLKSWPPRPCSPNSGYSFGKNLRLRSPQPVRGLQPVHGVGAAQFARLHDEGEQPRRQAQQK